jgi:hypothetical protein
MNLVCPWVRWRLSRVFDGDRNGQAGPAVLRHIEHCPRCKAYRDGLNTWIHALSADKTVALPAHAEERFLAAVRAVAVPAANPARRRIAENLRPAFAALVLLVALAALSFPLGTRIRRNHAVRYFTSGRAEAVRIVTSLPSLVEVSLTAEQDRLANDMARGLRFLAEGLPLLGALETAGADEALRR